jgi:hypothetical protein
MCILWLFYRRFHDPVCNQSYDTGRMTRLSFDRVFDAY